MATPVSEPRDLYDVLGVDPRAPRTEIRAAYVCLAKRHHPDADSGDHQRMVALNEAWGVLGNPTRRAAYDAQRGAARAPATAAPVGSNQGTPGMAAARPSSHTAGAPGVTLDFGRYAGWTLEALANHDPDYLEWLARVPGGRQYRAAIQTALSARVPTTARGLGRSDSRRSSAWHLPWRTRATATR